VNEAKLWEHGMPAPVVARMEAIARQVAAEWGVPLGPRIPAGRYSYVATAGEDAILKVLPPEDVDADHIADALRLWNGDGAVRLLRHDAGRRALLLERVRPGSDATALAEDEATAVAIDVGKRVWRRAPIGHPYRSIRDWVARWLPPDEMHSLVPAARRTYALMRPRTDTLIHADFHHHNLLLRGDDWVVIDPKPHAGEPEFDIPAFLWNPLGTTPTRERTERRIRAFADAGLDGDRIRQWAIVRGICDGLPVRPGRSDTDRKQLIVARQLL